MAGVACGGSDKMWLAESGGQELLQCSCWLKEEGLNKWWNDLRMMT